MLKLLRRALAPMPALYNQLYLYKKSLPSNNPSYKHKINILHLESNTSTWARSSYLTRTPAQGPSSCRPLRLQVLPFWYAVKPPRIHGAGVSALRGLGGARGLPARRHHVPVAGGPAHRRVHARCQYERHVGHHASPQTPPLHQRQREDG